MRRLGRSAVAVAVAVGPQAHRTPPNAHGEALCSPNTHLCAVCRLSRSNGECHFENFLRTINSLDSHSAFHLLDDISQPVLIIRWVGW